MILDACILSGCDYLDSLDGIGVKTAVKLLKKHRSVETVLRALRIESGMLIDSEYETRYKYDSALHEHNFIFMRRCYLFIV